MTVSRGSTCLLGAVWGQGDCAGHWPLPGPLGPQASPWPLRQALGRRSGAGCQAFSRSTCMACGSHSQYSATGVQGFFPPSSQQGISQLAFSATRALRSLCPGLQSNPRLQHRAEARQQTALVGGQLVEDLGRHHRTG